MVIRKENQLGLNFTHEIKDQFYQIHSDKFFKGHPEEFLKPFRQQWLDILSDSGNKNLLFTKTSMEVADKIKLDRFEPSALKIKKDKKFTFLIDDTHFYRVMMKNNEIMVLNVRKQLLESNKFYLTYDSFKIIPSKNYVVYPPNQDNFLKDKYFSEFLKMLIFIEYSEIEETTVFPNQKHGTKKHGNYLNESDRPFILVDSHWNKIIVRTEGFGVSGHLRWQPVGSHRQDRKLIYVREFVKEGYVRGSKKDLVNA